MTNEWSAGRIGRAMVRGVFARKLMVVPECYWAGDEADLLAVEPRSLRLIDVEIKLSRADFKRDRHKSKWAKYQSGGGRLPREWPRRVWKHYFCMPESEWRECLTEFVPSERSGILLIRGKPSDPDPIVWCERRAQPNPDAKPLSPAQVMDVARLASLRLWESYAVIDRLSGVENAGSD